MKKVLAILLLTISAGAMAHGHNHHGGFYRPHYGGWGWGGWVAPTIIGGVVGYELARQPVIVQQPPVIVQQPPVMVQPQMTTQPVNCTAWTETQNPDGTITRTRICQ